MELCYQRMASPIGELHLITRDETLCVLDFDGYESRMRRLLERRFGPVEVAEGTCPIAVRKTVEAYFEGDTVGIEDLATETRGTPFQERVWRALRDIPSGQTISYGELARRIGEPTASRAVGLANGSNPVAIVIPCHRVIGADGSLTGYGGGLERKQWLLEHEGALPARQGELSLQA